MTDGGGDEEVRARGRDVGNSRQWAGERETDEVKGAEKARPGVLKVGGATPPALSDTIEAHFQQSAPGQGGVAASPPPPLINFCPHPYHSTDPPPYLFRNPPAPSSLI
ncbi:unnamed protein product [Pleuronectes platessa]|uniref:Uncharacterized protein n=1 Tax=Pleuronectes platessa TaxID=8262 RepID=A0A9N7YK27_PLEPL|nr:unnamed protein product [Pleuronectes platessa]